MASMPGGSAVTAFPKANYPVEYFAALLTSVKTNLEKAAVYLNECRIMGIEVEVPTPTHIAVAIQYQAGKMDAPLVLAKGQELVAKRIREIAREHDIPLVENPPVARLLHSKVEVGQSIPEEMFKAVAEILAYVYSLKGRR